MFVVCPFSVRAVLVLCSYFIHSLFVLCSCCVRTLSVLCSCSTRTVLVLYLFPVRAVLVLCSYFVRSLFVLRSCSVRVLSCALTIFILFYLEALIKQYITNIEQKNKKRDVFDKGLANGRGVPTRQTPYQHNVAPLTATQSVLS